MHRYTNSSGRTRSQTITVPKPTLIANAPLATIRELPSQPNWRDTNGRTVGNANNNNTTTRHKRRSLSLSGAAVIAQRSLHRNQPWTAPSVQQLSNRMGNNATARPLLVEGPAGPVISAVGSQTDHRVANTALINAQQRRLRSGISMPTRRAGANVIARGGGQSFGAVYEYRDSFGAPKITSATSSTPESSLIRDTQNHQGIRNLMTHRQGSAAVVWSGVGTFPLGQQEMQDITQSIVEQRSKKYQTAKLRGPKPYSRHGY
tara:strand:- start:730 stop:1512 length:783 start_codon:yes stop_codon:yes gene_type:complete